MRPVLPALLLQMFALSGSCAAQTQTLPPPQAALVGRTARGGATVEVVDMMTRQVLLRREDGQRMTVVAGPEVRNLAHLRAGDRVMVEYTEAIAAEIVRAGDTRPRVEAGSVAARAAPGERPGMATGEMVRVRVRIDSVDREAGAVTFTGPRGATRQVAVHDPAMRDLARGLNPGDEVDIAYVEALAVRVEPSGR